MCIINDPQLLKQLKKSKETQTGFKQFQIVFQNTKLRIFGETVTSYNYHTGTNVDPVLRLVKNYTYTETNAAGFHAYAKKPNPDLTSSVLFPIQYHPQHLVAAQKINYGKEDLHLCIALREFFLPAATTSQIINAYLQTKWNHFAKNYQNPLSPEQLLLALQNPPSLGDDMRLASNNPNQRSLDLNSLYNQFLISLWSENPHYLRNSMINPPKPFEHILY